MSYLNKFPIVSQYETMLPSKLGQNFSLWDFPYLFEFLGMFEICMGFIYFRESLAYIR